MKIRRNIWYALSGLLVLTVVACGGGGGSSSTDDNNILIDIESGLLAYYSFSGNADDESDNENHVFDIVGAVLTEDRNANANSAYYFDGIDDEMEIPVNINPDVVPLLTMTAWVRSDDGEGVIISNDRFDDDTGFERTLGIDFRGGGTGWSAFTGTGEVIGFRPVDIGVWTFLAVVYDQANENITVYVNDDSFEGSGVLSNGFDATTIGTNPGFKVLFPQNYFEGAIDEVRIYSRALNSDEINAIRLIE